MAVNFSISEIRELSEQLSLKLNLPFRYMTHSFLKRRLGMFFDKQGIRKPAQLIEQIENRDMSDELCYFFSVNTTELFRDAGFWRHLRKLVSANYCGNSFRIWLPDVASGEELFSLLILLKEIDCLDNAHIVVNSTSDKRIEQISKGCLSVKKMDVNAYNYKRFEGHENPETYFIDGDNGFMFDTTLMHNVSFQKGGIENVPDEKMDIILLRNSLLYYIRDYHETIKDMADKALVSGGLMCLGVKEQLPAPYNERFECLDEKEKIYKKFRFIKD